MKKIKSICIILTTVFMLINIKTVYAASSISFSSSSPKVGESLRVTVSVPNVNTVDLKATVSGCGTNGTIQIVDGSMTGNPKTFSGSVTVTPTSTGTITVAISDSSNAVLNGSYVSVGGSRKITVSNKQSSSNSSSSSSNNSSSSSNNSTSSSNTTTTQEPEVKKSSEKNLFSLSVSEGTLSPKFSSGTTTYKVDLTSETESLTISAKAKDSKAKVSGTGKKELKIGENNFTVTVTAEDGSKKTYTISVYVTEKPTQFVKLGDQNLGILNDLSKTDVPKGFEKSTIKIDNKDVTALQNKDMGLTLLYLQNEDDSTGFYIYDVDNNKVLSKYQTVAVNGKTYVLMDAPDNLEAIQDLKTATIKIGDVELSGWKFEDEALSHYTLIYLMNEAGETQLYTYEDTEGTLQKYTPVEEENDNTLTYVFIGTTALFVVSTAVLGYMYISFKKKSISAIKDYYERKNQG
ncbi:cadherin-like beta sandwich domain-containing protein [Massilimicrobiota timonensis]|uniref:cadherin-like beta sandwich domain-containing protein n=1 Tax=Massilimicrobiota timonensis TaxID=1776392 RepID=UPI00195F6F94|nr:cadherin-like beta sandwich domain-containing protein [Massilimicrobiota timonensis]MBM6967094.1 cadherin-like beta sandwich domain-containing protein [Massilimicrobiota timonensis]